MNLAVRTISLKNLFLVMLAAATLGPLAIALIHVQSDGVLHRCASSTFRLMNILAAPHVVTTVYLLIDRRQLEGVPRPALTVGLVPVGLMLLCLAVLMAAPLWLIELFMLAFVFYGTWHFGRQNVGIATFAARVGNGRPLERDERLMLNLGVLAGLLVTYRAFAPTLMLAPELWPFDLSPTGDLWFVEPVLSRLWYLGIGLYALLVPLVVMRVIRHRHRYPLWTLVIYLGCVFFFLPAYLSDNALFLVTSWTVAHGLQYLVMLAFHAGTAGRIESGVRALRPILVFGLSLGAGVSLWLLADRMVRGADATTAKALFAVIIALTLAHYWIDQFLWRFRTPSRRAWLARSFPFLEGATRPAYGPLVADRPV
jgi:hypothetical protein